MENKVQKSDLINESWKSGDLLNYLALMHKSEVFSSLKFNIASFIEKIRGLDFRKMNINKFGKQIESTIISELGVNKVIQKFPELSLFVNLVRNYIMSSYINPNYKQMAAAYIISKLILNSINSNGSFYALTINSLKSILTENEKSIDGIKILETKSLLASRYKEDWFRIIGGELKGFDKNKLILVTARNMEESEANQEGKTLFLLNLNSQFFFKGEANGILGLRVSNNGDGTELFKEFEDILKLHKIAGGLGVLRNYLNDAKISLTEEININKSKDILYHSKIMALAYLETVFKGSLIFFLEVSEMYSLQNNNKNGKNLSKALLNLLELNFNNIIFHFFQKGNQHFNSIQLITEYLHMNQNLKNEFCGNLKFLETYFKNNSSFAELHQYIQQILYSKEELSVHKPTLESLTKNVFFLEKQTTYFKNELILGKGYGDDALINWANLVISSLLYQGYILSGKKRDLNIFIKFTKLELLKESNYEEDFKVAFEIAFNVDSRGIPILRPNL